MSRRPKAKTAAQSTLLTALQFISMAQEETGNPFQTHCILRDNWAIAFNGTVALGTPIEEDLSACPHSHRLLDALAKCGDAFSIVQLDSEKLAIKTTKFRAYVPCIAYELLQHVSPDVSLVAITDELKRGLELVSPLIAETAQDVILASALIRAGSCVGTNRHVMFEYWHGLDLPTFALPKAAINVIVKCGKPLASFGFSGTSATFYFADGSWMRSQLYLEAWPIVQIDGILNQKANPWPLPANFFEGVRAVAPFNDEGTVIFGKGVLRSHDDENTGALFECEGLPNNKMFNSKYLLLAEPYIKTIDFAGHNNSAYFYNDKMRGVIAGMFRREPVSEEQQQAAKAEREAKAASKPWHPRMIDDDIPF